MLSVVNSPELRIALFPPPLEDIKLLFVTTLFSPVIFTAYSFIVLMVLLFIILLFPLTFNVFASFPSNKELSPLIFTSEMVLLIIFAESISM